MPSSSPSSTRCGCSARIWRSLNVPGSDSSALQIAYFGVGLLAGHDLPLAPGREAGAAHAAQPGLLQHVDDLVGARGRRPARGAARGSARSPASYGSFGRGSSPAAPRRRGASRRARPRPSAPRLRTAPAARRPPPRARRRSARGTTPRELDLDAVAVAGLRLGDPLVGPVQPARAGRGRRPPGPPSARLGPEVRIERDQPLDLVQRPPHLARERDQLLARQPAVARWIAFSAGIRLGPGNLPARASAPGYALAITRPRAPSPPGAAGSTDGAELELGDLAERVDLVDRQHVGGRLAEVEGDEAGARACRGARAARAARSSRAAR